LQVNRIAGQPDCRLAGSRVSRDGCLIGSVAFGSAGAVAALIELKLSANAQFQDRDGACKLIETAAGRGDLSMAPRLPECRAT
jgi:hypothetical protein